ncbi:MAG: SdpI family protein, partial [Gammaproteobacteria bacterium]|nr:SdpI family protein [Gammaproteobacteria bacterium]
FRLETFQRTVGIFQNATLFFLALVLAAQLLYAGGINVDMTMLVLLGMGGLFIVLGNFLGKTRKNFFIGIRTPWTLASDEVWIRTHRLAGWLFVAVGILFIGAAPFGASHVVIISGAVIAALVPTFYSLWLYKRLEGFRQESE